MGFPGVSACRRRAAARRIKPALVATVKCGAAVSPSGSGSFQKQLTTKFAGSAASGYGSCSFGFSSDPDLSITGWQRGAANATMGDLSLRPTLALVAHDQKKADMVDFAVRHQVRLGAFDLVATGTTGARIVDAAPSLPVTRLKSGPLGGDQQIGALIAEGRIAGLLFFVDPLTPMPHDVDVKALTRLAELYDIPMALNRATAEILITHPGAFALSQ